MAISHVHLSTGNVMTAPADVMRKSAKSPSSAELLTSLRSQLFRSLSLSHSSSSSECSSSEYSSASLDTAAITLDRDTFFLPQSPHTLATTLAESRSSYDITVKLFLPSSVDASYVAPAINSVLVMLNIETIDLLILSLPGITFDAEDLVVSDDSVEGVLATTPPPPPAWLPVYEALEKLHYEGTLKSLGISDFNASRLRQLNSSVSVKPSVNQINVKNCCVVPSGLIIYAKQTGIELLTHNDDSDILPAQALRSLLVDEFGVVDDDARLITPEWVCKYTAVVRNRGVVENKGYLAMAEIQS